LPEQIVGQNGSARYSAESLTPRGCFCEETAKLRWYRVQSPSVCMTEGVFFMEKPIDILSLFPIRKSKKQKTVFLNTVQTYVSDLGYATTVEKGSFGLRNLIMGDPSTAEYVVTAHYDTCARLPFPNLITPCNFWAFLGWQLVMTLFLCLPLFVIGTIILLIFDIPDLIVVVIYLLLIGELALMMVGPANKCNANDNTSGVVAVLELAEKMPQELRDRVCFVLFDLEEAGLLGSSHYRKIHRKETDKQVIINIDCVGEGDEILLFPTRKLKKRTDRLDRMETFCGRHNEKQLSVARKGFSIYPSDQSNFPLGVGVAAFCRNKWVGLYLAKIHTKRDIMLDENNVAMIRDCLIRMIRDRV